jgi:hypothetical protein
MGEARMSSHLSPQQISKWMTGERASQEEQHVRECAQCSAEVAQFQEALADFGSRVRDWSERQPVANPLGEGRPAHPLRWAWVAVAALLLAAIPIYRVDRQRQAERARAEAALMEQVDAQVSRAIAAPMEPLAQLMTWDGKQ